MRSRSLLAGFTMAAILGLWLASASMPTLAGEPSAGPGPAAEAPASGAASTTPAPAVGAPGGVAPGAFGCGRGHCIRWRPHAWPCHAAIGTRRQHSEGRAEKSLCRYRCHRRGGSPQISLRRLQWLPWGRGRRRHVSSADQRHVRPNSRPAGRLSKLCCQATPN